MIGGLASLVAAYVLSQFFRAFLAVLAPALKADLGATAQDLAAASGLYFLTFAMMQIPVGWALDRIGPCRTAAAIFAVGCAGGALMLSFAGSPMMLKLSVALIGVGCSPVLMASYYVFARVYPAAAFGTLAASMIGIGSLGNIAASLPLAWAADALGWRGAMAALAGATLAVAAAIALTLRDPQRAPGAAEGSLLDLLRMPALWLILPVMAVNYAPAAGLRGLWIGPYAADVFGADVAGIGRLALVMGLAMVAGNFAYGPAERFLGSRKVVIFCGNTAMALCLYALWAFPGAGLGPATALLAGVGFFGASYGMVIAHGRAFMPPHLVGRGVTLFNLFGVGAVGLAQVVTGRIHAGAMPDGPEAAYGALFLFFAVSVTLGLAVYAFARDRID